MNDIIKKHHPLRHANSFKYAFNGLFHALINEPNFRVQILFTLVAVILGLYFRIDTIEWGLLIISSGFLLAAEMVNTVVEEITDHIIKEPSPVAKIIKDLSAGFVLTAAITAMLIFVVIFGHRMPALIDDVENWLESDDGQSIEIVDSETPIDNKAPTTDNEKTVFNDPTTEFYGFSSNDVCANDIDCEVGGCNGEICGSKPNAHASICLFPEQPLPRDLGYTCGCTNNKCMWNK